MDNGGLRYGARGARLSPPLPTATRGAPLQENARQGAEIRTALTDPVQANIIVAGPRKQTSGGRLQIGTLAGFISESVAGFILELLAGFVGIRTQQFGMDRNIAKLPRFHRPRVGGDADMRN